MPGWRWRFSILILGLATVAHAQSEQPPSEIDRPESPAPGTTQPSPAGIGLPTDWDHITDGWFGLRPKLEDHGIIFSGNVINDWAKNLRGGVNTEGSNFGQLLNANITAYTDKMGLWSGGRFFASFQNEFGEFATRDVGDIQVVDSIDADGRTQLSELWYEQLLLDKKLSLVIGKLNANGDFAIVPHGASFINSSMGISPTVLGIPKYPDPAMGAQAWYDPTDLVYVAAAIFDGALHEGIETGSLGPATLFGPPSDLFMIGEAGLKLSLGPNALPGKLGVGVWHHTGKWDRFDGGTNDGATGFYIVADQVLWKKHPDQKDDNQGLAAFFQYGWADPNISPIGQHIGAGLSWTGAIPTRDNDEIGLGITCAILSDKPGAGFDDSSETAIELFYKAQVLKWLTVQPDVQYVINPGGVSRNADAVVFILRVTIDL